MSSDGDKRHSSVSDSNNINAEQSSSTNNSENSTKTEPAGSAVPSSSAAVTIAGKRKRSDGGDTEEKDGSTTADQTDQHQSTSVPHWVAGASPPRYIGLEEMVAASKTFDKMALAHEIVIDPTFKLNNKPSPSETALEKSVREMMHKAFWDKLQEDISKSPPDYSHALKLLAEIKEILLDMLSPRQQKTKADIEEHLDLDLLQQQARTGWDVVDNDCLKLDSLTSYVLTTMGKLCSPARDEHLKKLKDLSELVPLFKGILELLDDMKLDMANFALSQVRPILQHNSVDYERNKFEELLKTNPGVCRFAIAADGLEH